MRYLYWKLTYRKNQSQQQEHNMTQLIRIIRPANFFVAIAATMVGAMLCSGTSVIIPAFLAGLATAFVLAAGNILNDIFDVEIDKYAHPQRPLPSGEMSKTAATIASIIFWAIAIVIRQFSFHRIRFS